MCGCCESRDPNDKNRRFNNNPNLLLPDDSDFLINKDQEGIRFHDEKDSVKGK